MISGFTLQTINPFFPILVFTQKASPAAIIATPVIKINNESILYLFKILLPTYAKPTVAIRHPANNHIVFSVIAASFIQLHAPSTVLKGFCSVLGLFRVAQLHASYMSYAQVTTSNSRE